MTHLLLHKTSNSVSSEPAAAHSARSWSRFLWNEYGLRGGEVRPNYLNLDRDFAVDELAVVYPILNAIFDPVPIVAEETDGFVRGRIG
jgi:hypothetical protein